jgi:RNA-directed DNA polymerase
MSIERFQAKEPQYLEELSQALREGRYQPMAVRRVRIPKGPGQTRPLGIPVVKDRIVQTALKRVLEPIFAWEFRPTSFGFRPGRGCKDALREVDQLLKAGYTYVVDADLKSYFDIIPQAPLLEEVKSRVSDGRGLDLLQRFLEQDILEGMTGWKPTQGTPQGAVLSSLLANLYLHPLDLLMEQQGHRMIRYADDFVILCRHRAEAEAALGKVQAWVQEHGLQLHPDKTALGNYWEPGQGFEFLGYRFEAGRRYVRAKSVKALKDTIRQKTRRTRGDSMKRIIHDLNLTLKGWFEYFKQAHRTTFKGIDGFVRRRLRALLRKQRKRPGFGRCHADQQRWPNAFFARQGLFTLHEAHTLASQSR